MELRVAWMCDNGALPETGGVLEQDARMMNLIAITRNVHWTVTKLKNAQGEQIHRLTDTERRLIRSLREEGYL